MNENIAQAFSGGSRGPPSHQEGLTAARVLSNELDAARFDPLLVKNVAKNVGKAIDMFLDRAEAIVSFPSRFSPSDPLQWLDGGLFLTDSIRLYRHLYGWTTCYGIAADQRRVGDWNIPFLVSFVEGSDILSANCSRFIET